MRVPTAILEVLNHVVLDVLSRHARQMNAQETLGAAPYLMVPTVYLSPCFLDEHCPK